LGGGAWSSVVTNLAVASAPMTLTESNALDRPKRFYRIRLAD